MYTGATVNAVTRSGTNQYHGTLFEFARHHAFNAIPYFNQREHGGLGTDDGLKRTQTGGTFGGPLLKDKLFFFGGLQLTNQSIAPATTNAIAPTQDVLRGENKGRHLRHVSIVKELKQVGTLDDRVRFKTRIPLESGARLIVFVQEAGNGPVWGAALMPSGRGEGR